MAPTSLWIKICANTSAEDALRAAEFGADAVGFVFAPSTRRVNPAQVRAISASLPAGLERVGVFPTATITEIADAAIEARLTTVQLHGGTQPDADPEFTSKLAERLGPDVSIITTLHWSVEPAEPLEAPASDSASIVMAELAELARTRPADRVLIDAKVGGSSSGGTGRTFDWQSARAVLASQPASRVIIAGGLQPANVAHAVRLLRPWGIDVASGVERSPGRKDHRKLRDFIENARRA